MISLIVAMSKNGVIGNGGRIPWYEPEDLRYFKRLTVGKPVIMGRKTWESLPGRLPNRDNIVITSNPNLITPGAWAFSSLTSALDAFSDATEIMIIGGANIYAQSVGLCDRMYVTIVEYEAEGDARFPPIDWSAWRVIDETHSGDLTWRVYEK